MKRLFGGLIFLLASLPASTNYQLHNYSIGAGGTSGSSSANYQLNGTAGEQSGGTTTSTTYQNVTGNNGTQQANTPAITLSNPSLYYNQLKFVIDAQNNPSDAKYAIAISTDNFATTNYIKSDDTVGGTLTTSDYQTYTSWGGSGGQNVIGLTSHTTYYVKAKAMQGNFTETGYGPVSTAATEYPHLTFSLSTSSISFSQLLPATVTAATPTIDLTFTTNAAGGGNVYILSQNGSLSSPTTSTPITSATADLASAGHGYGAQVSANGGGMSIVSPYNPAAATNVGIVDTNSRVILTAAGPVTAGTASITMKARAAITDAAAANYADTLTLVASASF